MFIAACIFKGPCKAQVLALSVYLKRAYGTTFSWGEHTGETQQSSQTVKKQTLLANFRRSGSWQKFKANIQSKQSISQNIDLANTNPSNLRRNKEQKRTEIKIEKQGTATASWILACIMETVLDCRKWRIFGWRLTRCFFVNFMCARRMNWN